MSELTRCNFCTLQSIRRWYKGTGARIHRRFYGGWTEIYVVPKGKKLNTQRNKEEDPSRQFVASFLELTSSCAC